MSIKIVKYKYTQSLAAYFFVAKYRTSRTHNNKNQSKQERYEGLTRKSPNDLRVKRAQSLRLVHSCGFGRLCIMPPPSGIGRCLSNPLCHVALTDNIIPANNMNMVRRWHNQYNERRICQSSWVVVVMGGAAWMEDGGGGVVVGWDR